MAARALAVSPAVSSWASFNWIFALPKRRPQYLGKADQEGL